MATEIRIIEIEIENYRQYYGINKIPFEDRKDGFTVVIGQNGLGKSNLLNAINWCFYKKEPHSEKNTGQYIINEEYYTKLDVGSDAKVSVTVKLRKGNDEYHISRVLIVKRGEFEVEETNDGPVNKVIDHKGYILPGGCELFEDRSKLQISIKTSSQTDFHISDKNPSVEMNNILPETLSGYFILDGEYIETFWRALTNIKTGLLEISQLNLLEKSVEHVTDMKKNVPIIGDSDIDSYTEKISGYQSYIDSTNHKTGNDEWSAKMRYDYDEKKHDNEHYHASGNPRIKELEEDIAVMKSDLLEISKQYDASGIQVVKKLKEDQEKGTKNLKDLQRDLENAKSHFVSSQVANGPLYLLKPLIDNTVSTIDSLRVKGDLPYGQKKMFTNDLLKREKCICGIDLTSDSDSSGKEKNEYRKKVQMIKDSMEADQDLDICVNMQTHFQTKLIDDYNEFTNSSFDIPRKQLVTASKAYTKQADDLKDIFLKLQGVGNVDVSTLAENQESLLNRITESEKYIGEERSQIAKKINEIGNAKVERNKLMTKTARQKELKHQQDVWDSISDILETTYSFLKEDVRTKVQNKTFEIFTDAMYKHKDEESKPEWKRFVINSDYECGLINKNNQQVLGSISKGEQLFLALSFISALKNITGYGFPLIIDTPLGKVSGKPRHLLSKALAKFLPHEQLIFFATDTEFLSPILNEEEEDMNDPEGLPEIPFGQMLEEHIPIKFWRLKADDGCTKIIDMIPRWRKKK